MTDDDTSFLDVEGRGVMSRAAFQLHSFAIVNSFQEGTPGFVSDDYLSSISAETSVAALELETIGMWERREGGYFVKDDATVSMLINHNERMEALAAECERRGFHSPVGDPAGWMTCEECSIPTQRPDGGPVALPDGGRLGPDLRQAQTPDYDNDTTSS
ncbi:MAG: hypothetical protein EPO52_01510 [Herbiconiux sp.]|uniref:hypothetical protein n=1 Tax=Herbiconiux sp. TaxID=1871186 RepID=UPI00122171D7|nr:hypothetical protein [Herbiconiux sp.]TAJ49664.1 MAG: hypothetical protein EPO52_01510 [Herbiconiux sp.]